MSDLLQAILLYTRCVAKQNLISEVGPCFFLAILPGISYGFPLTSLARSVPGLNPNGVNFQ